METNETIILSNGLITTEQKEEIRIITSQLDALDNEIKQFKLLEEKYDKFKATLYEKMNEFSIDKYISINGTQFTRVSPGTDKIEMILNFNEDKFKLENPDMYKKYTEQIEKVTKGKSGHLRITLPKDKEE